MITCNNGAGEGNWTHDLIVGNAA